MVTHKEEPKSSTREVLPRASKYTLENNTAPEPWPKLERLDGSKWFTGVSHCGAAEGPSPHVEEWIIGCTDCTGLLD